MVSPTARSLAWGALVLSIVALGWLLRLYDLTDLPHDFHTTRQLRNAIVARGLYYQWLPDQDMGGIDPLVREQAIAYGNSTGQYEPPILESLVALTYLALGQETLWVARVYTGLFWLVSALAVWGVAGRMAGAGGALAALAYTLLLPFGVQASRSFQPDPGMVMWIMLAVYCLVRWGETQQSQPGHAGRAWTWAALGGLAGGVAILTKVVAGYILAGFALALVLQRPGLRRAWRHPQVWLIAVFMLAPTFLYYMGRSGRASEYFASWTLSLSHLLLEPSFYGRWLNLVQELMGFGALLLALVGVVLAPAPWRGYLIGLWAGYGVYGLTLPYQMTTHNYYHEQLVPIVALSLAAPAGLLFERIRAQGWKWALPCGAGLLALAIFLVYTSLSELKKDDYRSDAAYWQTIGSLVPADGKILALTQDYGYPLMYYGWRKVHLWPTTGEQNLAELRGSSKEFDSYFEKRIAGYDYFLITSFNQLDQQPVLKETLYARFQIAAEGPGYLVFYLSQPVEP